MKVIIDVTQEDIDKGKPRQACNCPVALAISKQLPEYSTAVGAWGMYCYVGIERAGLPVSVSKFVTDFDLGWQVQPFSFELYIDN